MKKEEIEPNVIYYTTNYDVLEEVVRKTDEAKNSDLEKVEFVRRLANYIYTETGMVLVSFGEDKKLNGCHVISRHKDKFGEYLWIDFSWIDPHCPGLRKKYYDEIVGTCRVRGIKRIQMRMNRGFK
ncbi:unnamed protein product, partial [marine sediment metagenome]